MNLDIVLDIRNKHKNVSRQNSHTALRLGQLRNQINDMGLIHSISLAI